MRSLLRTMPDGVPFDALLARIKARQSFLIGSWERMLLAPEPMSGFPPAPWRKPATGSDGWWAALQQEYVWAFRSMEETLRVVMSPYFWLLELRTLAICLRCRDGGRVVDEKLLQGSLLIDPIRDVMRDATDAMSAVRQLEKLLAPISPRFASLPRILSKGGCGAVEGELHDISMEQLAATASNPVIKRYIVLMIDSRNLIAIAKHLRWSLASTPRLLKGGAIRTGLLEELYGRRDTAAIARLADRLGVGGQSGDPDDIEGTVLSSQNRFLRDLSRETTGIGAILYYFRRCANEARNLGVLSRISSAGSNAVETEILR